MGRDARLLDYATGHTAIELRGWLKRFVARVEADLFNERAEAARADRRVEINHDDDALSWLNAYLPAHMAAAVDKRLTLEAKKLPAAGRTLAQKRAEVAAVIPAETLAGAPTPRRSQPTGHSSSPPPGSPTPGTTCSGIRC